MHSIKLHQVTSAYKLTSNFLLFILPFLGTALHKIFHLFKPLFFYHLIFADFFRWSSQNGAIALWQGRM